MAEKSEQPTNQSMISWKLAAVLAVLSLAGGVLLGRVAFVSWDRPTPLIVDIEVLDDELEVSGNVEYLEEQQIYILEIHTMPPPPEGQVFQVWVQNGDVIVRAGVLDPESRSFAYAAHNERYDTMFITTEPAPYGSEQPSTGQLITVDLTELADDDEDE